MAARIILRLTVTHIVIYRARLMALTSLPIQHPAALAAPGLR